MKKLLGLLLCVVMVLSLTSCSLFFAEVKSKDELSAAANNSVTQDIKSYINNMQSTYDTIEESFEDYLSLDVVAKDNSLVYRYKYKTDFGDISAIKTTLDSQYDTMKPSMLVDLTALQAVVPNAESIIVEYYTNDNTLITKMEYKQEK